MIKQGIAYHEQKLKLSGHSSHTLISTYHFVRHNARMNITFRYVINSSPMSDLKLPHILRCRSATSTIERLSLELPTNNWDKPGLKFKKRIREEQNPFIF